MSSIITHTPLWVWGILGYLIFRGLKATKTHRVFLPTLFIIPGILLVLRIKGGLYNDLWIYGPCLLAGLAIGYITAPPSIVKGRLVVELPGSWVPLTLLLSFFTVKYAFGYLNATHPTLAQAYAFLDVGTTALVTGYFLGRAGEYVARHAIRQ